MKKILIAFISLIILTIGIYKVYDFTLEKMIREGKLADNGYGHNYLPEMANILLKKDSENKKENKKEKKQKIYTENEIVKMVTFDERDNHYYIITEHWVFLVKGFEHVKYDIKTLAELNRIYSENSPIEIQFTDDENIVGYSLKSY